MTEETNGAGPDLIVLGIVPVLINRLSAPLIAFALAVGMSVSTMHAVGGARKVSVVWTGSNLAIAAGLESRGICVADARRAG